ncbi:helix-turn-helix transcriptional regulator [Nitrospirillum iridis]|uniref:AraC-like DNA-binding protein n=1 Tax=Nitrospirillum iridis TaxID=765888 RepID=A0A7X0AWF0_9PROT|nr:AraC family transcriptional regulator [Nitrospirillum iridis]MBB6250330.1 AraC-like DNA-binding protein [Nitrospirillum iridis]
MLTIVQGPGTAAFAQRRDEIAALLKNALALLENDSAAAAICLQRAAELLRDRAAEAPPVTGGLAPWQVRRVQGHICQHLADAVRIRDVAALARLSTSYFSRAFRITFGMPFTQYIIQQRMECAKRLMATTDEPLSHIALTCGLADQAHLTRLFRQTMGATPAAWRRCAQDAPGPTAGGLTPQAA